MQCVAAAVCIMLSGLCETEINISVILRDEEQMLALCLTYGSFVSITHLRFCFLFIFYVYPQNLP